LEGYFSSSTTPAATPTGALAENNQDHGLDQPDPWATGIRSDLVNLTLGGENTGETGPGTSSGGASDNNSDITIEFGFTQVALGNQLWFDGDGDGLLSGVEDTPVIGALVELLNGSGQPVVDNMGQPITDITDGSGFYYFSGLQPGGYRVRVAASNFASGEVLEGYASSNGANESSDPEDGTDSNDEGENGGSPISGGVTSGVVTLAPTTGEPTGEAGADPDGLGLPDENENLTVDFGFILAPPPPSPVPTLQGWTLGLLGMLLVLIGGRRRVS